MCPPSPTSAEASSKVLPGLDAYDTGAGSSTLASPQYTEAVASSRCHGSLLLAICVARLSGRYLREPELMVNDAMHCAQVMSAAPEPYFEPVLVHRRRTHLELVRLLARRGMVSRLLCGPSR